MQEDFDIFYHMEEPTYDPTLDPAMTMTDPTYDPTTDPTFDDPFMAEPTYMEDMRDFSVRYYWNNDGLRWYRGYGNYGLHDVNR